MHARLYIECLHSHAATSHEILIMYVDNLKGQSAAFVLMMYVYNYQLQKESMN